MPRLLMALVASAVALGATVQTAAQSSAQRNGASGEQPRLLLSILVDGLESDYLDLLRERLTDGGFRRLERDAVYIPHADYGPGLDAAAATALLMTGAAPSLTGIAADVRYDRDGLRAIDVYADASALGNFSTTAYSPAALRVTTLTDEARISAGGTNVVYAVAANPSIAIPLAGHAANSALWLDGKSANWASSTFYKEMPVAVATRNRTTPLSVRMDTMSWTPTLRPDQYPGLPEHLTRYPFRYVFPRANVQRLDMLLASPMINREVSTVAADLLATLKVGQHQGVTDVLNIAYTLEPFNYGKATDTRLELMDAYVKLDGYLAQLFADVDRRVGLNNTVVMLAATPPRPRNRRDDEQYSIPYGEFSTRKAVSLLNMYLIAMYGNGEYVSAYHRGHLYLNHKTLKDKSLDERAVRTAAAGFLTKMTGIDRVFTIDEILEGHAGENAEALRRNTVAATAGDLVLNVAPGFEVVDDYNNTIHTTGPHMVERVAGTTAPVFIMAPGLAQQVVGNPVDARAIAPTVAGILRIRSPNGASVPALSLLRK